MQIFLKTNTLGKADIKIKAKTDKDKNIWILTHMVSQMVRFGMLDLKIRGKEENLFLLAKSIGRSIGNELKNKLIRERGIALFLWPFEQSLSVVLIDPVPKVLDDKSEKGEPYFIIKTDSYSSEERKMLESFCQGLAKGAQVGILVYTIDSGRFSGKRGMMYNTHHQLEAVGKALGRIIRTLTKKRASKLKPFEKEEESERVSLETNIKLKWKFNGVGESKINLKAERDPYQNMKVLERALEEFTQAADFNLSINVLGDDEHHVYEDLAIVFGNALNKMLEERKGIMRTAFSLLPLPGGIVILALDLGRGYCQIETDIKNLSLRSMVHHFFETFSRFAKMDVVVFGVSGDHPIINYLKPVLVKTLNRQEILKIKKENLTDQILATNIFKSLGRALGEAIKTDPKRAKEIPSTKGIID